MVEKFSCEVAKKSSFNNKIEFCKRYSKVDILYDRAFMMKKARSFFEEREIIEVDVPLLTQYAPIDCHIDLVESCCMGKKSYLQSSPEYGMKRLLSLGLGDIYQLSHAFRDGESGERHNPEFMMVEWYRINISFEEMMRETILFLNLFLDEQEVEILPYKNAFNKYSGRDILSITHDRDIFFANEVEPYLGQCGLTVLIDFPPEEAALARMREKEGEKIADRFEIYYQGMELANGYRELTDPKENKKRLEEANEKREMLNKKRYPMDLHFLSALEKTLPDMCGVSCGFDRLMMLRHKAKNISEIIPFSWEET